MGTLYIDTGGAATNSGSTDTNSATVSGANATVAGSVVTLDGAPDLSGLITSGPTQSSIHLSQATNTNQKIFWITAFDNTAKTVTVSVAPTGVTGSAWAIGGRHVWTPASIEQAVRAGDTVIFNNSVASSAATILTQRVVGTSAAGYVKWVGKAGTRPVITATSTNPAVAGTATGALNWLENLELIQQGASGNCLNRTSDGSVYYNVKISDAGAVGIANTNAASGGKIIGCEISGCGGDAVNDTGNDMLLGNYLHDCTGDGYEHNQNNGQLVFVRNIIDTCGGRGIYYPGAASGSNSLFFIDGNTVYGCGNSGFEVADADYGFLLTNNIFSENGNAAGEYNIEWTAGSGDYVTFHAWNIAYHSGGGGGANLSGITMNVQVSGSEFTTDPAFTNPGAGDFTISVSSPAKGAGYPGAFLGGPTGSLDLGAVQRVEPSASVMPIAMPNSLIRM